MSVQKAAGKYWNGTDFNTSTTEQLFAATGTTSWTLAFAAANFATAGGGDGSYTVRTYATDNAGNVQSPATSVTFTIDNTPPSNSLSLTAQSPAGSSFKSGSTVYYRGTGAGSGGSFKIRNAVSDAGSGPASSTTASLGGTTSGWLHTPGKVSAPSGGPYDSNLFTWTEGTSSSPTEVVTGADAAGNTTAAPALTFTNDSTNPVTGALTVNGQVASGAGTSGYSSVTGFTIGARTDYTDADSGIASSILTVQSFTLANNSCGAAAGAYSTATTITGTANPAIATGFCYVYTLLGTDKVGNAAFVTTTVLVDTTAPTTPTLSFSGLSANAFYSSGQNTVYIRPAAGGTFTVTAASSDPETAIAAGNAGYTFSSLAGNNVTGTQTAGQDATRSPGQRPSRAATRLSFRPTTPATRPPPPATT